jgi:Immunoglobulin domain/Lysyl oxidase
MAAPPSLPRLFLRSTKEHAMLHRAALAAILLAAPAMAQCIAPPNFAASQGTNCNGVQLAWGAVSHATSYTLAKNITNSPNGAQIITGLTSTTYLDTAVQPDRVYYYWVQATGGLCGNASPASGPVTGFIRASAGPVNNFSASYDSACGGIELTWDPADHAQTYDIWRNGSSPDLDTAEYLNSTNQTSYLDTLPFPLNVSGGHPLFYWVRATAPCGNSAMAGPWRGAWVSINGLPDLSVSTITFQGWHVVSATGGGYELRFGAMFDNVGTGQLNLALGQWRQETLTYDFLQLTCDPGMPTRLVGQCPVNGPPTISPFATYRLRERPADQSVGAILAQSSLTSSCLRDDYHSFGGLPGSPFGPIYDCIQPGQGLSVGWSRIFYEGSQGQPTLSLACIPSGDYWLEAEVNPAGLIAESSTSNNIFRRAITLTLTANNGITITSQPASRAACIGGSAVFSVSASAASPTYRWYRANTALSDGPTGHGSAISGAATPSLTISQLTPADADSYSCLITAGPCTRTSSAAALTVNSADFNNDGDIGTDTDIEAFFACLAGTCCPACGSADFNADGDIGTDADIESFFRVLAGGAC